MEEAYYNRCKEQVHNATLHSKGEQKNMKVLVKIYDGVKYFRGSEKVTEHTYTDVESWKVVGGKEAEEVEKEFIGNDLDELQEYLILSFADGTTATFRNSHTDLFKIL